MSKQGGNLTRSKSKLLFNTLTAADFGAYANSKTSQAQLIIKKHGIIVPGHEDGLAQATLAAGMKVLKAEPVAGTAKETLIEVLAPYPADTTDYEYDVVVKERPRHNGDPDKYMPKRSSYGSRLDSLAAAAFAASLEAGVQLMSIGSPG